MILVRMNGEDFRCPIERLRTLGDLIELVKASIDLDSIITDIQLDGAALSDADWRIPLVAQANRTLDVTTGPKAEYLAARLTVAPDFCMKVTEGFQRTREHYQGGMSFSGNSALSRSVNDLQAFLNWYRALLDMGRDELQMISSEFDVCVDDIRGICEQIIQQQLSQSWTTVAETLECRLEPALDRLGGICSKASDSMSDVR